MRLFTAVIVALTVLLVTSPVGAVAATPSSSASAPAPAATEPGAEFGLAAAGQPSTGSTSQSQPPHPASVTSLSSAPNAALAVQDDGPPSESEPQQVFRIAIDETGDAHWTIESRFVIAEENEDEFLEWARAVAAGERDVTFDRQLFEQRVNEASDRTGREMALENAGWEEPRIEPIAESTDSETGADEQSKVAGVVRYSFTWTNFATTENDRIYVGDAFRTETGVWLSLSDTQRLVIEYPDGYALDTPTQLEWTGPYEFEDDELEIVFVRSAATTMLGVSRWLLGALSLLVVVVGVGSYLLARRNPDADLPASVDRLHGLLAGVGLVDRLDRFRSDSDGDRTRTAASPADTDGGTVQASDSDETGAAPGPGTSLEFEEEVDDDIDPELLSDEERVLRLLKRNGGRMKQGSIVSETGWSNAKVSQLLSQMDEDGEIEKLRIGRENLITLPEVDPTEID